MPRPSPAFVLTGALLVLLVAGIAYVTFERYEAAHTVTKTDEESLIVPAIDPGEHLIGQANAPVQLIVYADLSCQYCNLFFLTTLPKLQAEFGDKIAVAYRHLPLPTHANSLQEASAAECVSDLSNNDDFWQFVHAVLSDPNYLNGLDLTKLTSLAEGVGVPQDGFSYCMQSGMTVPVIDKEALQAAVAGITETPSTVFKSSTRALIIQGDYPSEYETAIRYLLATSSAPQ